MEIKGHLDIIKNQIAKGDLKDAISRLRQLMDGSNTINDIIAQSANLSILESNIIAGVVSYDNQYIARSQITSAVLKIIQSIQDNMGENGEKMRKQVLDSLDDILRKHGVSEDIHKHINKHREVKKEYRCLWIDDNPINDEMEMQALFAMGLVCRTAKDPYKAYEILNKKATAREDVYVPDLIIINSLRRLKDNENEGIEFCKYLAQKNQYQNIPILLHSVHFEEKLKKSDADEVKQIRADLPQNIKNRFEVKNTLIIRDLIEEVALIVFGPAEI